MGKDTQNVYQSCPVLENEMFLLRLLEEKDAKELFRVYSDRRALPFFNSDNCHGDIFYYPTEERMNAAVRFWLESYANGYFVRFTVIDKAVNAAVGTVELFRREAEDYFNDCGLLRLDLSYDYENSSDISEILSLISGRAYSLFGCSMLATKAPAYAVERIAALKEQGFVLSDQPLVGGDDKKPYDGYWVRKK